MVEHIIKKKKNRERKQPRVHNAEPLRGGKMPAQPAGVRERAPVCHGRLWAAGLASTSTQG